jgi:two-component system, sporulation sensor kinase E
MAFIEKLLKRLDRFDRESIENYIVQIVRENNTFEEILNHLTEGVLLLSQDGTIKLSNSQASKWLNKKPSGNPKISEVDADPGLIRLITTQIHNLKEKTVKQISILAPREMQLRIFFVPLTNEEVLILLLAAEDHRPGPVTDERLERIESLIRLSAGIAHEIGNPLNSIGIHLALLKKDVKSLPENQRQSFEKKLDVLNTETARLDKIVKNFLKATRKPPVRFRSEDLNELLEEAINFMRPELEENRIQIRFRADRALPLCLMDRERMHQVFINLIKNAMEAMPEGGQLTVSVSHRDKVALIQFKDQGSGIDDADLPHIFEAYYTTKEGGSGLGLMTVFNGIRDHGGRIEVKSRVGEGTTFTLLLPIRQPRLQLPPSSATSSSGKGKG